MKTSELISKLNELINKYGDLDVHTVMWDGDESSDIIAESVLFKGDKFIRLIDKEGEED